MQLTLSLLGLCLVAFGQPAWEPLFGLLASFFGYALFLNAILDVEPAKRRFWLGMGWFTAVQFIQLSWMLTHPFWYIVVIYVSFALMWGAQFGVLCLLLNRVNIRSFRRATGVAALWTLLEWSRLFFLSGFTWNPAGLALTGYLLPLQLASIIGIYGLSFWVMWTNLLVLRAWRYQGAVLAGAVAFVPYVFGLGQFWWHEEAFDHYAAHHEPLKALLVQPGFPIEETLEFATPFEAIQYVADEWHDILQILKRHRDKTVDLVSLPEYAVPYGTYLPLYRYDYVKESFGTVFGEEGVRALPPLVEPLAVEVETPKGSTWMVSNGFWSQAISNLFQSDVVVGLEHSEFKGGERMASYTAAFLFRPNGTEGQRYDKRVLIPLGEYIPFTWCRELVKSYGIVASLIPGEGAKVYKGCKVSYGFSICYEETFGHLMRESRQLGAELLVNVTSDVWYPNSRLPQQHLDHARLRTVESGIPMVRACNTGLTCAVDSLGRTLDILGEGHPNQQWLADALYVSVPTYTYPTLYSMWGDTLIVTFSFLASLAFLGSKSLRLK